MSSVSVYPSEILKGAIALMKNGVDGGMDAITRSASSRKASFEELNSALDYFTGCNTPETEAIDAMYEAWYQADNECN